MRIFHARDEIDPAEAVVAVVGGLSFGCLLVVAVLFLVAP